MSWSGYYCYFERQDLMFYFESITTMRHNWLLMYPFALIKILIIYFNVEF
ncbi:hypothetical protein A1OE_527 [Candidatus Endolissoclinum faulkneri L2]|uniref:Uncharacterized protein n=1 Tax=Candidatus Endolissoclinum faulkneri L2 TaxID=1193729 RepID=K7YGJ4_9PROT|nr:hypothetical protein A1OE_527 [Candidatus Endolissoclinum faulkneri L2]